MDRGAKGDPEEKAMPIIGLVEQTGSLWRLSIGVVPVAFTRLAPFTFLQYQVATSVRTPRFRNDSEGFQGHKQPLHATIDFYRYRAFLAHPAPAICIRVRRSTVPTIRTASVGFAVCTTTNYGE